MQVDLTLDLETETNGNWNIWRKQDTSKEVLEKVNNNTEEEIANEKYEIEIRPSKLIIAKVAQKDIAAIDDTNADIAGKDNHDTKHEAGKDNHDTNHEDGKDNHDNHDTNHAASKNNHETNHEVGKENQDTNHGKDNHDTKYEAGKDNHDTSKEVTEVTTNQDTTASNANTVNNSTSRNTENNSTPRSTGNNSNSIENNSNSPSQSTTDNIAQDNNITTDTTVNNSNQPRPKVNLHEPKLKLRPPKAEEIVKTKSKRRPRFNPTNNHTITQMFSKTTQPKKVKTTSQDDKKFKDKNTTNAQKPKTTSQLCEPSNKVAAPACIALREGINLQSSEETRIASKVTNHANNFTIPNPVYSNNIRVDKSDLAQYQDKAINPKIISNKELGGNSDQTSLD